MPNTIFWDEETRDLSSLSGYSKNPRKITDDQLKRLKDQIAKVGYHHPIAVQPDGTIISGHQRARALKELGFDRVRVTVPDRPLTESEFREMLIATNLNAGEFDMGILSSDFSRQELIALGMPVTLMNDFDKQLRIGAGDADECPPVAEKVISQRGDVWICGDHRVMCGDSTVEADVEKLLQGATPNLMVTDPPYGVEYDADFRNGIERANGSIVGARAIGKVENDERHDWREAWDLFKGNVAYIWHASYFTGNVQTSLEGSGFEVRASIIWAKNHMAIGRGHYHWQHEPCWYVVRKGSIGNWCGDRKQTTVWQIDKPNKSETGHSTQKPIECMRKPIENNSKIGDEIYDPFLGSGTTVIAAEQTQRKCIGMELSPTYVDIIVKRWQNFSGKEATHEETGVTFDTMVAI